MTVAAVLAAGGAVLGADQLATPSDPHVVVAYRIRATAPTRSIHTAITGIIADTEISEAGLVPWQPLPSEEDEEAGGVG